MADIAFYEEALKAPWWKAQNNLLSRSGDHSMNLKEKPHFSKRDGAFLPSFSGRQRPDQGPSEGFGRPRNYESSGN
jgi:hypothetical protein